MEAQGEKKEENRTESAGAGRPGKKVKGRYIVFAIVAVAILLVAGYAMLSNNKLENKDGRATAASVTNSNATSVEIPLSSISQNATWYQYAVNGASVRFFAVRDSTDAVHTAFDECPYCYPSHLGFRQEGSVMVENCCNMGVSIAEITSSGMPGAACHPAYLESQVVGEHLVINTSDLAAGAYLFG
jgi:uncharacterized membrane protein